MSRLCPLACLVSLALAAWGVHAQTPVLTTPRDAALALPLPQPPIPAPTLARYPGVIRHQVDASDLDRRIVRVRQVIPVTSGPLTLLYPKYLPGNHADTGPIQLLAGLTVTAGGRRIAWRRDTLEPYAFHLDVPDDVDRIEIDFQWLTQADNAVWRVVMTPAMLNMQFEKALLYPAGYTSTGITFATSIQLPLGWNYATALETRSFRDGLATFAPTDLYTLVDSPIFAGANFRRIDLDPDGEIHLNIVGDRPELLAPTEEQLGHFRDLVIQADRLFGPRPFDRYDFLMALSDQMGSLGLEHHRSSENVAPPTFFTDWHRFAGKRDLLAHEFTHAWNGKYVRPADELTAGYDVPTQSTLLWVYEGQTRYWGDVLAARTGLHSRDEALIALAEQAAFYANQPGREWRPLQDTTNHNLLGYRSPGQWTSWMRTTSDYYGEGAMLWLDVDTLIRERTDDQRSLDDFARAFFGHDGGAFAPRGYTFQDVVDGLNAIAPYDWADFLRTRLDATGPQVAPPLDGITRGGYRLVYVDALTEMERRVQSNWGSDFQYSLGFSLSGASNRIVDIRWEGLAYQAAIGAGWDLMAVDDVTATPQVLRDAVTAAKGGDEPIVLTLRSGSRFRTVAFDYHDGLRYPRLERIDGVPDRLGAIFTARPD